MRRAIAIFFAIGITAIMVTACVSCSGKENSKKDLHPLIHAFLTDSASEDFINAGAYPLTRAELPIGFLSQDDEGLTLMETFLMYDGHDNIDGREVSDGIRDFAGEHFNYQEYTLNNKDAAREEMLRYVARMINPGNPFSPAKIIVAYSDHALVYAQTDLLDLMSESHLKIPIINVTQTAIDKVKKLIVKEKNITVGVLASPVAIEVDSYQALSSLTHLVTQECDFTYPYTLPVNTQLIEACDFDFSFNKMYYRGARFRPSYMRVESPDNYVRQVVTTFIDQLRNNGAQEPLRYLILGHPQLSKYTSIISQTLIHLRNYRKDNRYVYRHLIDPNLVLIDPAQETAREVYQRMIQQKIAAYRPTPCRVRLMDSTLTIDSTKYPLLNVCLSH